MVDEELNSTRSVSLSIRSQLTTLLLYAISLTKSRDYTKFIVTWT